MDGSLVVYRKNSYRNENNTAVTFHTAQELSDATKAASKAAVKARNRETNSENKEQASGKRARQAEKDGKKPCPYLKDGKACPFKENCRYSHKSG